MIGTWKLLLGLAAVVLLAAQTKTIRSFAHKSFSKVIHTYLCWRYPINSVEKGTRIPTCPYSFPDGQGNVAKFLEGQQNRVGWSTQYGNVYRIWNGMKPEIVISDPKHIQAVFKSSDKHKKAENINAGWLFGALLGDCLGLISGQRWKTLRTIWDETFSFRYISEQCLYLEETVKRYLIRLPALQVDRGSLHTSDDLKLLSFWIIAEKLYGPLSAEQEAELAAMVPTHEELFHKALSGGFTRFNWTKELPTDTRRKLDAFKKHWADFNERAYHRAMSLVDGWPIRPDIINLFGAVYSGEIPKEESLQTMYEVLMGNLDVTLGAMSWALVFIIAYNQQQIREEIRQARASNDPSQWIEYLLNTSTLLHSSVLESSRLKPLAAFSVPQAPEKDHVLDGYNIPAGTDFVIDSSGVNIKNDWWGKDADAYRPERFQQKEVSKSRYNYWRFGFGPRHCLGKYLADLTIKATIIHLLENYSLKLAGSDADHDSWRRVGGVWITQANLTIDFDKQPTDTQALDEKQVLDEKQQTTQ